MDEISGPSAGVFAGVNTGDVEAISNVTEDGSQSDGDEDAPIARHTFPSKLSRDKAKSLSRLPFADKQQLVRDMFLRREQSANPGPTIPKAGQELDDGGIPERDMGLAKKVKPRGRALPGLSAVDENNESTAIRSRSRGRKGGEQEEARTDHSHSIDRTRESPSKSKGKRVPLKSFEESRSQKNDEKPRDGHNGRRSPHRKNQDQREPALQQVPATAEAKSPQTNSGQSITIRLPPPPILVPSSSILPPFVPAAASATDKLLLRQTVSSFEQCLHHALDTNVALMTHMTHRPTQPSPPALLNPSPSNRTSLQALSTCSFCTRSQHPSQLAVDYVQGISKIKGLIGQVQATTSRHAKAMDAMVQAVTAERERRAADEIRALVSQMAVSAGHPWHRQAQLSGNGTRLARS